MLLESSFWCWRTVSGKNKNTWMRSEHCVLSVDMEDLFQPTRHAWVKIHKLLQLYVLNVTCCMSTARWTAKVSNQRSRDITPKKKKVLNERKVPTLLREDRVTPRGPLLSYYNSYWFQLVTRCGGQTTLASSSSLRSLLSAHTKLRTTGLLTGWGKVMRLLACHLWGEQDGT